MKNLLIGSGISLSVSMLAAILTTISPWFLAFWFAFLAFVTFGAFVLLGGKALVLLVDEEDEISPL